MKVLNVLLIIFFLCSSWSLRAQDYVQSELLKMIENNETQKAAAIIQKKFLEFRKNNKVDSLADYVSIYGNLLAKKNGFDKAEKEVHVLLKELEARKGNMETLALGYHLAAQFYYHHSQIKKAFDYDLMALNYAKKDKKINLAKYYRSVGEYARRMTNIELARKYYLEAIALEKADPNPKYENLYLTYVDLANMAWFSSKLDSAVYFYDEAIKALERINVKSPKNTLYRKAIVFNNLAGLYNIQGDNTKAILYTENSINLHNQFQKVKGFEVEKKDARNFENSAIDNLGGIFRSLGNYSRSQDLLLYSYDKKKREMGVNDHSVFISEILLGQIYYARNDLNQSFFYTHSGLNHLDQTGGEYLLWQADGYYTLGLVYERKKQFELAQKNYKIADSLYNVSFGGEYDNIYFDFLHSYDSFLIKIGNKKVALERAFKNLQYLEKAGNNSTLLVFDQLLHLSSLYFKALDYSKSKDFSKEAIANIDLLIKKQENKTDSLNLLMKRSSAQLAYCRSIYQITTNKDVVFLKSLLNQLTPYLAIYEEQKRLLTDQNDINAMIEKYRSMTMFIERLNLEIYELNKDFQFLNAAINLHENALYSRMRVRMEAQQAMQFRGVPAEIIKEEEFLKARFRKSWKENEQMSYTQLQDEWRVFLRKLKQDYPAYYALRYQEKIFELKEIQQELPKDQTLVRYLQSEGKLYAWVITSNKQVLVPLSDSNLSGLIESIDSLSMDGKRIGKVSNELYVLLWKPIEKYIVGSRVKIIPDGALHNLSFEILSPQINQDFASLAKNCLLSRYAISYDFSLSTFRDEESKEEITKSFVAFTPVFSKEDKNSYINSLKNDSLYLDRNYLNLLSLPLTASLAQESKKNWGGSVFSNTHATTDAFRTHAGNNHIIHIGTHAEANNEFPEYSKLIFAKNKDYRSENSLYLFDIYNCNLQSNLAVLSACETGRTNYSDGEGMISLALAFRYAGSESILAGLWSIDEYSSTDITNTFYKGVREGLTKDVALQQAKLDYLNKSEGRLLSPTYWAGLALIGDISPVNITSETSYSLYLCIAAVVILLICFYFYKLKRKRV